MVPFLLLGSAAGALLGSSYPQIVMVFPSVDNHVDKERLCYFHCVETPNPPAMNANPITMFQLPMAWIGHDALVT